MKKAINALVAVFATVAMAIAGFVGAGSAFADGATSTTQSYKISFPTDEKYAGHTYEVYQIFTGDYDGKVLSNVKYGANGAKAEGTEVTADELKQLTDMNTSDKTDQEKLNVIKKFANLDSTPVATLTNTNTSYTAAAGYYLIKDKDGTVSGDDANTLYIAKVVGDVAISPKSDVPSFQKKVKDVNDTTGDTSGWQDSADYDFGDKVPFQLTATLPNNYSDYKTYYLAFHDVEENGLSFNKDSVKVAIDGQTVDAANYTVKTKADGLTDGCTFEVKFADLKKVPNVSAGSKIRVEYTSTLNDNAVLGQQGNVNKAKLQFSNNPNSEQEGENGPTGETPWDNVIVFTYKVIVNKVDKDKHTLAGAAFKLEKKQSNGTYTTVQDFMSDVTDQNKPTSFEFKGLDDGEYRLSETKTPAGYNSIDPITFTVTANHTTEWNDNTRTDVLTSLSGDKASGSINFTADKNAGSLTTNVVNKSGSSLPETGGMGTIVLYGAGAALVIAAGAYFALRKKSAR